MRLRMFDYVNDLWQKQMRKIFTYFLKNLCICGLNENPFVAYCLTHVTKCANSFRFDFKG